MPKSPDELHEAVSQNGDTDVNNIARNLAFEVLLTVIKSNPEALEKFDSAIKDVIGKMDKNGFGDLNEQIIQRLHRILL